MSWRKGTAVREREPAKSLPQLTLRLRDVFDVRAAIRLGDVIRSLPAPARIVLDFSRVAQVDSGATAALVKALALLRGYQVRTEGLRRPEQAFLERLGASMSELRSEN